MSWSATWLPMNPLIPVTSTIDPGGVTGGLPFKLGSSMDVWMPWQRYGGDGRRPDDNNRHRGGCSQVDALKGASVRVLRCR